MFCRLILECTIILGESNTLLPSFYALYLILYVLLRCAVPGV